MLSELQAVAHASRDEVLDPAYAALGSAELLDSVLHGAPVPPALPRANDASLANARRVMDNCFDLIGEAYVLPNPFSWRDNPSRDPEWQIAQHKFYFAVDLILAYRQLRDPAYLQKWVALLNSWLDEMSCGFITASDAQVEARRVEQWVYALLLLRGTPCRDFLPQGFVRRLLERIATDTWYISQHLKPSRNHRTYQLWTVFLVGVLFPQFRLHRHFLETGRELLIDNLLTDFLPDGVHVELSTHYHQLALEVGLAFVDLARRNGIDVPGRLMERLKKAARFSMFVQWPNGSIPLLNDSDDGDHLELLTRAGELLNDPSLHWVATLGGAGLPPFEPSKHFASSGYFVFSDGWGRDRASYARRQHVVYDCARLGEGSHSHYDLFNFTYFCNGRPAVVDPGRYTYSPRPDASGTDWRRTFKSTAAHNTVTIDGRDQTRYLSKLQPRTPGAPKHGPEVQVEQRDFHLGQRTDWVLATARSAEYTPRHQRLFVYVRRQYLLILDHIFAEDPIAHEAVLRFHLPDDCLGQTTVELHATHAAVESPRVRIHTAGLPGLAARAEDGWVSTSYGVKTPAPVVSMSQTAASPLLFCSAVSPAPSDPPSLVIQGCRRADSGTPSGWLFRVDGTLDGLPFVDCLLFQSGPAPVTAHMDGLDFRGQFLLWRRSGARGLDHLVAGRVEDLAVEGAGAQRMAWAPGQHVEWSIES